MHRFVMTFRRLRMEAVDAGYSTVEYAVGVLGAAGLALLLCKVLTSTSIQSALNTMILRALK
ncbi:hypothetical protein ACWT_0367 [Actinoplanes sp. SE50]|nr:hypothetical protein ACPL_482 [Actinoplanes sp. SE50/110]ATO79782.1 hypothetical protein ACWT_0367 [Actinoplanes sp. SE50]SLL97184.1 hypothetical protein ACSP50_0381 [Actinoplanes sp. SE50/110]